ncbi:TnsA endonuclease N-terminal domain-containing protein [Castellaniella sp.]|uniref:TnsA endonuclease N-terminal domain-containing protein n=1 Tax=Castellaniella sp. TaxID=1955812 RepID=UPI003C73BAAB
MIWTEEKIRRMEAEGRGRGSGAGYRPWLEVASVSSIGRSRRVSSPKTGRTHHLLSDVEHDLFLACEWAQNVVDIREQYPLPREVTQTIAQKLRIRHPFYPGTHVPTVMTVDFLLTVLVGGEKKFLALNAKRDEEANDVRSLEKLEIQRTALEEMEVSHYLIYDSQIPQQKLRNIEWIRGALMKEGETEPYVGFFKGLASRMTEELATAADPVLAATVEEYCTAFDVRHGVQTGTGLRVVRMLMAERSLMPDLTSPDLTRESLASFIVTGRPGRLRAVGGEDAF